MAKDPVCGMDVDETTAKHTTDYKGQTYYFCAPGCMKAFQAEPETYLDPQLEAFHVIAGHSTAAIHKVRHSHS